MRFLALSVVETTGLEPVTSCVWSKRSDQLSYASDSFLIISQRCPGGQGLILQDGEKRIRAPSALDEEPQGT